MGYEIEASEALGTKGTKLLIPLPDTISASGEHLMVPASAKDFVSHDLAGFGAAVIAFRAQLGSGRNAILRSRGRQVVSTSTADTVGKVDDFVVDPRRRAVSPCVEEDRWRRHVVVDRHRGVR